MLSSKHLPTGTVTFLFTDIEGSTRLAQEYPEEMPQLLARHNAILNKAIEAHHGLVFRIVGDSFSAAFDTAIDAVSAALEAQHDLHAESWSPAPIRVRMGIHTGSAAVRDDPQEHTKYEGYATLALTQRVMSVGHGGQILLSQVTHDLVKDRLSNGMALRDLGEHRLKDIMQRQHMYQVTAPGLPSEFPSLTTLETINHNLPAQLTSFIGREEQIAEARQALSTARLLTFSGPGGTGKTRLSLQVAGEQLPEFKDGVWLIELASLTDPNYILSAVTSTFHLRENHGVSLLDTVTDYLRGKQLLLILDNCEHLIEACAQLAQHFLQACPTLKIIASSREALGVAGETVYRVPSLSMPHDISAHGDLSTIENYEAPRLFVERARKVNPGFVLTEENAPSVTRICQRLDGIPLAIELAAARVKMFTPQQIAERLDDRFKLLTTGDRAALPRQQTLRALIDWSYLTLNDTEQNVIRSLAVFSGGWTFDAAESVAGEIEAMDGLSGLVNKSLVNVEEKDGESRYGYLETIRRYAMEKLHESGHVTHARDRHLAYFMDYARRAQQYFDTDERLLWIIRLEEEHDNIRSAIGWALESDPESALQMVCALTIFWLTRSYLAEGCSWCEAAIDRAERSAPTDPDRDRILAEAYSALALLSINRGDHNTGQSAAQRSAELARQVKDHLVLARALNFLGISHGFLGDTARAFESLHESASLCRQHGYRDDLARVLLSLAYITLEVHGMKAVDELQSYLEESLSLSQGRLDQESAMRTEGILARLALYRGDLHDAKKHADLMLDLHRDMGDQFSVTGHQSDMAHVARQLGNYQEALALYHETLPEWHKIGHRGAVAHQLECLAFIAIGREQGERAAVLMSAAQALREASNSQRTPQESIEYDRELGRLRAGMDAKTLEALWAEGRSLTMEQAIELALNDDG